MRGVKLRTRFLLVVFAVLMLAGPAAKTDLNDPDKPHKSTVGPIPTAIVVERDAQKALRPIGLDGIERQSAGYRYRPDRNIRG